MHRHTKLRNALILTFIITALFGLGLTARRTVLAAQFDLFGADLPFTLESALEFRYIRMIYQGRELPKVDLKIQAPEGVNPRETYTIGAEYVYAWLARLLPNSMPLQSRVRWIAAAWFCLGIPMVCLWIWWWRQSLWGAALAGTYYAIGLASVMRSTGQELSHENFALPLLAAHLAGTALAERTHKRVGVRRFIAAISAGLLAIALCCWDLIQFYVMLWAIVHYVRLWGRKFFRVRRRAELWTITLAALVIAGVGNPYLRAHHFSGAPHMLLALGMLPGVWMQALGRKPVPGLSLALLLLPAVMLLPGLAGGFGLDYGHFGELIYAKLRFCNNKPADPALLTFDQSILWTPALNSVNWSLTKIMFPAIMPLVFWAVVLALFSAHRGSDPEITHLLFYFIAASLAFWLFMRFHVFAALFSAALLGWLGSWCARHTGWLRAALLAVLWAAVTAEAAHTICHAERWGATPAYMAQQEELLVWLRENISDDVILANFGLSAGLVAYGDFPVVLHPKFEAETIRHRTREYGELLFKGNEAGLRDWADKLNVRYYVYALGEFSDQYVDCQMRYFVDALHPPESAPARIFEYQPFSGRYFKHLWGNSKYRVFRVITHADEQQAEATAGRARQSLLGGDASTADKLAQNALLYDPHNVNAAQILIELENLRCSPN